jgi:thymidylate synthase (FAD)
VTQVEVFSKTINRGEDDAPLTVAWTDYIPVLDKGFVRLEGSLAADLDPVNSARVSFGGRRTEMDAKDRGLVNFLARERHGTPFEHAFFRFEVKAPIFVFREWHRHRIGVSINEQSGRYMQLEREFYVPAAEDFRVQKGKPGAYYFEQDDNVGRIEAARYNIERTCNEAFDNYEEMLAEGVAKEIARIVLPVNTYSTMWWSCNPRSLMSYLSLRNAPNAQREIAAYAEVMEEIAKLVMPVSFEAFVEHGRKTP